MVLAVVAVALTTATALKGAPLQKVAWYADLSLVVLAAVLSWIWWLPRTLTVVLGLIALGCLGPIWLWGDPTSFTNAVNTPRAVFLLQLGAAFTVTFTMIMAFGKALHVLVAGGRHRSSPRWLWIVGALGASALLAERAAIFAVNQDRREWLGYTRVTDPVKWYRSYIPDLFEESVWILMLVAAAALMHHYARYWFEPRSSAALSAAIVLFFVGPMWLDIDLWGISLPVWIVGFILIALARLFYAHVWRPVLAHEDSCRVPVARLRALVREWYEAPKDGSHGTTPVDRLLALGPSGDPRGT